MYRNIPHEPGNPILKYYRILFCSGRCVPEGKRAIQLYSTGTALCLNRFKGKKMKLKLK
jgi:hypothetical protein